MGWSWLKTFGHGVRETVHVVEGVVANPIAGAVLAAIPGGGVAVKLLTAVHGVEDTVEAARAPGGKAAAAFLAFKTAEGLTGDLADDALVKAAAEHAMAAYVAAQNALAAAKEAADAFEAVVADARTRHAR